MNKLSSDVFIENVYRTIYETAPDVHLMLLESQLSGHPSNRYTLFASDPDIVLSAYGNRVFIAQKGSGKTEEIRECDPWEMIKVTREKFPGWYFGHLGYDLKNHIENLHSENPDITGAPDLMLFRPTRMLKYDHHNHEFNLQEGLSFANKAMNKPASQVKKSDQNFHLENLSWITQKKDYLDRIKWAQQKIRDGDFYEINLSHVLTGDLKGNPFDLYLKMKAGGAVPFASYTRASSFSICCSSPERFLCRKGNRIFSQPIKGTAPRLADPEQDHQIQNRLKDSEKEKAENLMIVDLVRHDLSKVAIPGTIRVPELYKLHSFETVHQLISTVEGRVENDTDPVDILKACFPMGSMTGAPKISAMNAIEKLEDYKRGIYSGAAGYITPEGDFDFNVVIRTAIVNGRKLFYPAGGAITSDSIPEDELEETMVKARALTSVLKSDSK